MIANEQKSQRIVANRGPLFAEVECLTCGTVQVVDRQEGGAEIKQQACREDDCGAHLCKNCPQFICEGCESVHCLSHRTVYGGEELCSACLDVVKAGGD